VNWLRKSDLSERGGASNFRLSREKIQEEQSSPSPKHPFPVRTYVTIATEGGTPDSDPYLGPSNTGPEPGSPGDGTG